MFRGLTTALMILGSGLMVTAAHAEQVTLRVTSQGGINEQVVKKYITSRFEHDTGIKVEFVEGDPPTWIQRLTASKGRPAPVDVISLDDKTQPQAIEEGLVMKLDPSIVTNLKHLYKQALQPEGYGPGTLFWGCGLMYNTEKFKEAGIPEPKAWADLWNPKLAGRISVADISGPCAVDFTLAAARLAGGDESNLEPGLKKIAELKLHSFFSSSSDIKIKLKSGEVWIAPWNNGRSWDLIGEGFPGKFFYPEEGGFVHKTTVDVAAGTKHPKEAQMLVNYMLDPVAQTGRSYENPFGPTNSLVGTVIQQYPEQARKLLMIDDVEKMKSPNWKVIFDNFPALVDSWNRIVKG